MFSFQGTSLNRFLKRFNEVSNSFGTSVNLFKMWWRLAGSNRWPPACKAGALPAELNPQIFIFLFWSGGPRTRFSSEKPRRLQQSTGLLPRAAFRVHFGLQTSWTLSSRSWLLFKTFFEVVGQNGLEPSTSRLSVVCSSQLSYWPISSKSNPHSSHLSLQAKRSPVALFLLSLPNPFHWDLSGTPFFHFLGTSFPVPSKLNNVTSD